VLIRDLAKKERILSGKELEEALDLRKLTEDPE
jgi:hypothetical protein